MNPRVTAALSFGALILAVGALFVALNRPPIEQKQVQPRTEDDQPITMAGGSFFLGNDPYADWVLSSGQLQYMAANTLSNVKTVTVENSGVRTDLTRTGELVVRVTLTAGPATRIFEMRTNNAGQDIKLTPPSGFAGRYRRPLWNLRFWKMLGFDITRIEVTGVNNSYDQNVQNGDASILVRFN
ncbi:MAG: hypothetical protein SFV18_22005 [Bryobacteraceae bacterium]|nr:hypothetical protein [Bryobacteraceae bacterium]